MSNVFENLSGVRVLPEYKKIDVYIDKQAAGPREALIIFKECILTAVPDATELFNYNIPVFVLI